MKFWVGVTDNRWFSFLSRRDSDEVNFWQPSARAPFSGLERNAPFLFKLKSPHNHIAGGGTFVSFSTLPLSLAWEAFEQKNGAATRLEFEQLIRPLMTDPDAHDPEIGCTILSAPYFWPKERWIPNTFNWAGNIVRGRYYETAQPDGERLWQAVQATLRLTTGSVADRRIEEPPPRYGTPTLVAPRLGQGGFRVLVTDAYRRHCAITGESTLPVLEAAHIRPYTDDGPHAVANGLLLRSDFHRLFDAGLITVTPELHVEVSPRIREEWFNGKNYYRLHGKRLETIPDDSRLRPSVEYLRWHNEQRYQS